MLKNCPLTTQRSVKSSSLSLKEEKICKNLLKNDYQVRKEFFFFFRNEENVLTHQAGGLPRLAEIARRPLGQSQRNRDARLSLGPLGKVAIVEVLLQLKIKS